MVEVSINGYEREHYLDNDIMEMLESNPSLIAVGNKIVLSVHGEWQLVEYVIKEVEIFIGCVNFTVEKL